MKGLREKFRNKKGFTLVEMLIVVAIIAILVAISIPMVSYSLERAKQATDDANLRSAKATAVIEFYDGGGAAITDQYYDAANGKLVPAAPATYGQYGGHDYIKVSVAADGTVSVAWNNGD